LRSILKFVPFSCAVGLLAALFPSLARAQTEPFAESATFVVNTSTLRIDTDGDGIPDAYEIAFGLNQFLNDANEDPDADGFTNIQEYNAGTNPKVSDLPQFSQGISPVFTVNTRLPRTDTDGDGIPDDWEIAHGLDPFRSNASEDPDLDGLTNLQEYNAGTNPNSNDSSLASTGVSALFSVNTAVYSFPVSTDNDGDGMPDWWEQKYGLNPHLNDAGADADGDGISNLVEYQLGQNPTANESPAEVATLSAPFTLDTRMPRIDTDGDGIPDAWEIAHGLDPLRANAGEDPDGDGKTNLEEYNAGTDPKVDDWKGPSVAISQIFIADTGGFNGSHTWDTDGDGMPDWWEIQYGLNPYLNDANGDLDGDGIPNVAEFNSGTNPTLRDNPAVIGFSGIFLVDTGGRFLDSDGDGLPDWWEKLYFNDARIAEPSADADGDGMSNLAEFMAGSNPTDPNSTFRITDMQFVRQSNGSSVTLRWASFAGSTYSIWSSTVPQGPYTILAASIPATPPFNTSTNLLGNTNTFFRIGVTR
jgi:hypothetical protein